MATVATAAVTVNERRIYAAGKKKRNRVTVTFGNGVDTYPAGGIVMPSAGSFGMIRQLDYLLLVDPSSADGFLYKYDQTNNRSGFTWSRLSVPTPRSLKHLLPSSRPTTSR
jgi:hypothetical protein